MLNNIKIGQLAKKHSITVQRTKFCESMLKTLWNEGFILGYRVISDTSKLKIFLRYSKLGKPIITSLQFLSKPGKKIYLSSKQIWKINSKAFLIISTNKGLKSINECKKFKIGGEPIVVIK